MDISVDRSPCEVCEYKMNGCEPMTASDGHKFCLFCRFGIGSFPWHELKGGDNNDLNTCIK